MEELSETLGETVRQDKSIFDTSMETSLIAPSPTPSPSVTPVSTPNKVEHRSDADAASPAALGPPSPQPQLQSSLGKSASAASERLLGGPAAPLSASKVTSPSPAAVKSHETTQPTAAISPRTADQADQEGAWKMKAEELTRRVEALEAENAVLKASPGAGSQVRMLESSTLLTEDCDHRSWQSERTWS